MVQGVRRLLKLKTFIRPDSKIQHESKSTNSKTMIRLAKRIAMSGLCSRREAELQIQASKVKVNGVVITNVTTNVNVENDVVMVKNQVLTTKNRQVWIAHKLKGELITTKDPKGRTTIFDRLQKMGFHQHIMPVGRLDFNTEGLLLLTNDGDYARELEHPSNGVTRVYRALVRGHVLDSKILELKRGPVIHGMKYRPIHVTVQSRNAKDSWLHVLVTEGKNREVRKALAHVRLVVKQLIRIQYGPYRLADLPPGAVLEVRAKSLSKRQT
ncbi:pseudouridine synthase [Plasmopara halstedii]|uniref:Pseudouridine synthase n=1 Tax=Plasmopara halstedii TaxID=4781 RepID=A0A0P1B5W5_PLAHL|nr:pseudouridine synthase [Plasmopara halstedii]CEG49922.1 pseudouridine synthase [Plasmopara halstedii]|eukprot:XP_024586291.1 pseudouridine synthase [Plasmopara halstedii]